jgi:hypothetical protein
MNPDRDWIPDQLASPAPPHVGNFQVTEVECFAKISQVPSGSAATIAVVAMTVRPSSLSSGVTEHPPKKAHYGTLLGVST